MLADFKKHESVQPSDSSAVPVRKHPLAAARHFSTKAAGCTKSADAAHAMVENEHGRGKVESLPSLVANRLPSRRF